MKKILIFATALLLSACATFNDPPRPMPRYTYQQYPVIGLNVASINVVQAYSMPMQSPNAEHLMPEPLPQSVNNWARNHFKATGTDGVVTITIKDASVIKKDLAPTQGIKGKFTVDQTERYDARVVVEFKVDGASIGPDGSGLINVTRGQTIAENASLQDRDRVWTTMAETMMTDIDAGAQNMLAQRLSFLTRH